MQMINQTPDYSLRCHLFPNDPRPPFALIAPTLPIHHPPSAQTPNKHPLRTQPSPPLQPSPQPQNKAQRRKPMPPPPNTPLAPSPTQKLKRGYQTEFFPGADEDVEEDDEKRAREEEEEAKSRQPGTDEMRQETERRERAALILGSYERLSWHSRAYGEVCVCSCC